MPAAPGAPPWTRVQGSEAGVSNGTFGVYGPRTEQFAIGSLLYYMTRGFEPYENDRIEGPRIVNFFQEMIFPILQTDDDLDLIIGNCWTGVYESILFLSNDTKAFLVAHNIPAIIAAEEIDAKRDYCETLVSEGFLGDKA